MDDIASACGLLRSTVVLLTQSQKHLERSLLDASISSNHTVSGIISQIDNVIGELSAAENPVNSPKFVPPPFKRRDNPMKLDKGLSATSVDFDKKIQEPIVEIASSPPLGVLTKENSLSDQRRRLSNFSTHNLKDLSCDADVTPATSAPKLKLQLVDENDSLTVSPTSPTSPTSISPPQLFRRLSNPIVRFAQRSNSDLKHDDVDEDSDDEADHPSSPPPMLSKSPSSTPISKKSALSFAPSFRRSSSSSAPIDSSSQADNDVKSKPDEVAGLADVVDPVSGQVIKTPKGSNQFHDELSTERYMLALKAQEAFMLLDTDHSGSLDVSELKTGLISLGIDESTLDDLLARALGVLDQNNNGAIEIKDFVQLLTRTGLEGDMAQVQKAFTAITDDFLTEHNRRNKDMVIGSSRLLLDPRGPISCNWDIFVALLLVVTTFSMPLSMGFVYFQKKLFPLDLFADIVFMLDLLKHFFCGYIDEFDFAIMDFGKNRRHYLATWFVPDFLSSVPFEILDLILRKQVYFFRASKVIKLLRLGRLAKVFRLTKVTKLGKLFTDFKVSFEDRFRIHIPEAGIMLGRLLISLLVLAHWIVRLYNFPDGSWVVFADLQDASTQVQYGWCIFKALAQMIGVGFDIPPIVNTSCLERTQWCTVEHWITLICLYIGSIFYALLISSVSYVLNNMSKGRTNLSNQLWTLNEYMKSKKVPHDIRERVRAFYRIQFAEGKMYNEEELLCTLPPHLRHDILSFNQRHLFKQVPFLSGPNTPHALRARLAPKLSKRVMFAGETIFEEGSSGYELFFVVAGIVEIESNHSESIIKSIADGCYFGDVAVLLGCKRTARTRARTNVVMSVIDRKSLLEIIFEFPTVHEYLVYIAEKRRLRLATLNPEEKISSLTAEQMKDEEDSLTKYFIKLESAKHQESLFMQVHNDNTKKNSVRKSSKPSSLDYLATSMPVKLLKKTSSFFEGRGSSASFKETSSTVASDSKGGIDFGAVELAKQRRNIFGSNFKVSLKSFKERDTVARGTPSIHEHLEEGSGTEEESETEDDSEDDEEESDEDEGFGDEGVLKEESIVSLAGLAEEKKDEKESIVNDVPNQTKNNVTMLDVVEHSMIQHDDSIDALEQPVKSKLMDWKENVKDRKSPMSSRRFGPTSSSPNFPIKIKLPETPPRRPDTSD